MCVWIGRFCTFTKSWSIQWKKALTFLRMKKFLSELRKSSIKSTSINNEVNQSPIVAPEQFLVNHCHPERQGNPSNVNWSDFELFLSRLVVFVNLLLKNYVRPGLWRQLILFARSKFDRVFHFMYNLLAMVYTGNWEVLITKAGGRCIFTKQKHVFPF